MTWDADLRRWGLAASAIAIVCLAAGYCARIYGPLSREAQLRLDSARVARAAFDSGTAQATARYQAWADSVERDYAARVARLPAATTTTQRRGAGVQLMVRNILQEVPADQPELRAAVSLLQDSLARYDSAVVVERALAADLLAAAARRKTGDSLRILELGRQLDTARTQRDQAMEREAGLVKALGGGWHLGVTLGPGASLQLASAQQPAHVAVSPLQVTVGLSRDIKLPRLLPW